MAKKKSPRRANLTQETLERARVEHRSERFQSTTPTTTAPTGSTGLATKTKRAGLPRSAATRIPTHEELRQEYQHVMRDLRKIVILAAILLLVLIGLALILPSPTG